MEKVESRMWNVEAESEYQGRRKVAEDLSGYAELVERGGIEPRLMVLKT